MRCVVNKVATDPYLKTLRVDVQVGPIGYEEDFVYFYPFDENKKPTPEQQEAMVELSKAKALGLDEVEAKPEEKPKAKRASRAKKPEEKAAPEVKEEEKEAPEPVLYYYKKGDKKIKPVLAKILNEELGTDWKEDDAKFDIVANVTKELEANKIVVFIDDVLSPTFKTEVKKLCVEI